MPPIENLCRIETIVSAVLASPSSTKKVDHLQGRREAEETRDVEPKRVFKSGPSFIPFAIVYHEPRNMLASTAFDPQAPRRGGSEHFAWTPRAGILATGAIAATHVANSSATILRRNSSEGFWRSIHESAIDMLSSAEPKRLASL